MGDGSTWTNYRSEEAAERTDVNLIVSALNSTPHERERTLSRDWTRQ